MHRFLQSVRALLVPVLLVSSAGILWSPVFPPATRPALALPGVEAPALLPAEPGSPGSQPGPAPPVPQPAPSAPQSPPPPPPAPAPPPPPPVAVGRAAGEQLALVNQDRVATGAPALSYSTALARVAQYRADDMLNRDYFSHADPATGQLAFVALLQTWRIPYSIAGENIAWSTNPSMAGINTMFMNSPEHRANILNPAFHQLGIGVATNGAKTIVVQIFSN